MAKQSKFDDLLAEAGRVQPSGGRGLPPVHLWNPPFCGAIDMRIARDGTWHYAGTPIGRPALVKLFASILRKDEEGFMLVTPVERVAITVEDAPFLAVEMAVEDGCIRLRTTVDDWFELGSGNRLWFEPEASGGLRPYAEVRRGLSALVARPVFYELAERVETREVDGVALCGITSGASFFPMMPASELAEQVLG